MKIKMYVQTLLSGAIGFGCASGGRVTSDPKWMNDMQKLSAAHRRLIPLAADDRIFAEARHAKEIDQALRELSSATASIVRAADESTADPLVAFSAKSFGSEIRQAVTAFGVKDLEWARYALNRASGYCISCHTRSDQGRAFNLAGVPSPFGLTTAQRIDFYLANRDYEAAQSEAFRLASDPVACRSDAWAWNHALERALAMIVRAKADRASAANLVETVLANRGVRDYQRREALAWLFDIREWQREANLPVPKDLRAVTILRAKANFFGPNSRRKALILNLRASQMVNKILENSRGPLFAEALLQAGLIAQDLDFLNLGALDQYYFERCIRERPHSRLAESCYERLESSLHRASPYLNLDPGGEWVDAIRLDELRGMAKVKSGT